MFRNLALTCLSASVLCLVTTGCEKKATYIDATGTETIVEVDRINIQDWNRAADEMIQSMLTSGVLERAPEQPAILAISRIVNNTTQQVDTNLLTRQIRVALNQSGKTVTTTTMGLGGNVEDPLAKAGQDMQDFYSGENRPPRLPYFSLSGRLIEDRARAGNVRQSSFVFQLSLTEVSSGLAVWEDQKIITKQGSRPSVGW